MMANIVKDLKMKVTMPMYSSDKVEDATSCLETMLPPILKFQGKNKYLCTNEKPTYVDFWFFELICAIRWATNDKVFQDFPALKYYYDAMCELPKLKEHLADPNAFEKKLMFNFAPFAKLNGAQNW